MNKDFGHHSPQYFNPSGVIALAVALIAIAICCAITASTDDAHTVAALDTHSHAAAAKREPFLP